jgi:hypothetical protein
MLQRNTDQQQGVRTTLSGPLNLSDEEYIGHVCEHYFTSSLIEFCVECSRR